MEAISGGSDRSLRPSQQRRGRGKSQAVHKEMRCEGACTGRKWRGGVKPVRSWCLLVEGGLELAEAGELADLAGQLGDGVVGEVELDE